MANHLHDLTIVILSRGRERILGKCLDFWNSNGIKTVVIHNSNHGIKQKSKIDGSVYIISNTSYAVRAGIAANLITTNFAIICNDDELYIPSALEKMIMKLNENNELISVGAQSLAVSKYGPLTTGSLIYRDMVSYSNLYENSLDRLMHHLDFDKNHIGAMFRMLRSGTMIDLLTALKMNDQISTPYIHENTSEILLAVYGKTLYLNELYWIRNWQEPKVQHNNWDRKLYFHMWWEGLEFTEQKAKWLIIVSAFSLGRIKPEDFAEILERNYKLRKTKELHEKKSSKKQTRFQLYYVKYLAKKYILHSNLPLSLDTELASLKLLGIQIDEKAIRKIVKILI